MTPRDRVYLGLKRRFLTSVLKYHSRRGVFPIEIRTTVGLGARLEWCLEIMAYCDERSLRPQFKFSYPTSLKSEDYFDAFFSIKGSGRASARFARISSIIELDLGKDYDSVLNLDLAQYLIAKYLIIKEEIIREVDAFCARRFANRWVLGVHYRGTDKRLESPPISYETVKANIDRYLQLYPDTDSIFIATDDLNFLRSMKDAFLSPAIISRDDEVRSSDGSSVHRSPHTDKYAVNRDAIVNCLILSRCDGLLKTSSILSDWSKLFNPELPIVLLSRSYDEHLWFPERELMKENLFEPVRTDEPATPRA
jgi:hypothetical protein